MIHAQWSVIDKILWGLILYYVIRLLVTYDALNIVISFLLSPSSVGLCVESASTVLNQQKFSQKYFQMLIHLVTGVWVEMLVAQIVL